ncbi:hypothetical protein [Paracoccus zhejiangensis]|uniref:Uncharacterized protein n=1 Tax=Paracoccus zhejiangensis TaxID=1077935 RepID=A0A2H5F4P8_9RHOB|nr:hypothetical protein [Paracoccus zhejiangensis]AUH66521.1 hypothetical protein CX676_19615 [Paracoccus zhejiangensis]
MKFYRNLLRSRGAEVEVMNAYCFDDNEFFAVIQAVNDTTERRASILVRVPKDEPQKFEVLDEFDRKTVDYYAPNANLHFVQASGRHLRVIRDREMSRHSFVSYMTSLMHLAGAPQESVIVYGDEGMALHFKDGTFSPLETGLEEDLHALHVNREGLFAVGGNYGAFAMGSADRLNPIDLGIGSRIVKLHVRDDGSVAIALDGAPACELRGEELITFNDHPAEWFSICTYDDSELWGDSLFGMYLRRGAEFVPMCKTGYAYKMNVAGRNLVVNSAFAVRIFDGASWRTFALQADPDQPFVETELDFEPNWPG